MAKMYIHIYITRVKCIKQEMRGGILLCGHEIDFPFPNLSRSLLSSSSSRWDDQNLTHKKTRSEKYISPKLETSYSYRYRFTPPLPQPKRKRIITSNKFHRNGKNRREGIEEKHLICTNPLVNHLITAYQTRKSRTKTTSNEKLKTKICLRNLYKTTPEIWE